MAEDKEQYDPPELEVHGSLQEFTQGSQNIGTDSQGSAL